MSDIRKPEQFAAGDIEKVTQRIDSDVKMSRVQVAIGSLMLAGAAVVGVAAATHNLPEGALKYEVAFEQPVQDAINAVDDELAVAGMILIPTMLAMVGGNKLLAYRSTKASFADKESSSEMSDTGKTKKTLPRRALETAFAGSVPAIAAIAAGLATFSASLGSEITDGPSRPIEAFGKYSPGEAWIVQDKNVTPMFDSFVPRSLTDTVATIAVHRGIRATPFDLLLGDEQYRDEARASLSIGAVIPAGSPISWNADRGCGDIRVAIDSNAGIPIGSQVLLNGHRVTVAAATQETSAINRVGFVMPIEAMSTCIKDNDRAPVHGLTLDTSVEAAQKILDEANTGHKVATVISKEQYIKNSEAFWRANVKPITNTLSLVAFGFAGAAMAGAMGSRLFRNRREWSIMRANGVETTMLRYTELIRAGKDALVASAIGVTASVIVTPLVGFTSSGLRAGAGVKEMFVGAAVGSLGPILGTAIKLARPHKIVNKSEGTRV